MRIARVEGLTFWPGRSSRPALDGIDLDIDAGEVVMIAGASGSGKSTLLRALSGLVPHFHGGRFVGRVGILGRDTRSTTPAELAGFVGSVFQDPETQAIAATVARDVAFGAEHHAIPAGDIPARVAEALDAVGATNLAGREITTLSGGERQRVALAAILVARPRLLLLDEPTSQLDDDGVAHLERAIERAAADGVAVVIAEHHRERISLPVTRTLWLADGRIAAEPVAPQIPPRIASAAGEDLLCITNLTAGYGSCAVLDDCDLRVAAGEVVALHGANGSGKSTLARVIAGLHAPTHGRIEIAGSDMTATPAAARYPTVGFVPQDAGRFLLRERVADEVALGLGHLPDGERHARTQSVLRELDLAHLAGRHPLDLSVGERERVALAAMLVARPRVLILDEPSRGMDPERRDALARLLRTRAADGAAVVLITHDPAFAALAADRHVTLRAGHVDVASETRPAVAA